MQPLKKIALLIFLTCLAHAAVAGSDFAKDFEEANHQYEQGKFDAATRLYDALVLNGHYAPTLFYNLGNTEFRLGNSGAAVLNYERALVLDPSHPEARANLAFVRDQVGSKVFAKSWRDRLTADFDINTFAWIAAAAAWGGLFALGFILFRLRPDNAAAWLAAIACATVFCGAFFAIHHLKKDITLAIVVSKSADARFAPADNSTLAAKLPAGSRVRILERRGEWTYCALPDNDRAWIPSKLIERVRLQNS